MTMRIAEAQEKLIRATGNRFAWITRESYKGRWVYPAGVGCLTLVQVTDACYSVEQAFAMASMRWDERERQKTAAGRILHPDGTPLIAS